MVIPKWDELRDIAHIHYMQAHTESTDRYEQQEVNVRLRLFEHLSQDKIITEILFSDPYTHSGRHCLFDALILSAGTWLYAEAKERKDSSTKWNSWLIEESKAMELEQLSEATGRPALFVTLTADGFALLWSISAEHVTGETTCARKSFEPALGRIKKTMRYYPTNTAQVLR